MKKIMPAAVVVASCALGIGLIAVSLATANFSPEAVDDDLSHDIAITDLPTPVVGNELFAGGAACMNRDAVIGVLLADQNEFGGQTLAIVEGRDQAFANAWRDQTGVARIDVSGVVGHAYFDDNNQEWTVDVVEFAPNGCAMSRTLLPGTAWTDLIEDSSETNAQAPAGTV